MFAKVEKWFLQRLFIWLKARYWGVGFELQLPPEFVIGRHAQLRLGQRTSYKDYEVGAVVVRAWYDGAEPPPEFVKDAAQKPDTAVFRKYVYKKYGPYIFIFGLMHRRMLAFPQKHLITIVNWN